jgi:hypothetical protein
MLIDSTTDRTGTTVKDRQTTRGQVNGTSNAAIEQSRNKCYTPLSDDSVAASAPLKEGLWQKIS